MIRNDNYFNLITLLVIDDDNDDNDDDGDDHEKKSSNEKDVISYQYGTGISKTASLGFGVDESATQVTLTKINPSIKYEQYLYS